jgi:hypothetical protein
MTEPIPALVYHQPKLGRGPLFVALAILAVVFGLLAAITSVAFVISYIGILSQQKATASATVRLSILPTILNEILRIPAHVVLMLTGIAYLARSRSVPTLLCVYLCISIVAALAGLVAASFYMPPAGAQVVMFSNVARFIPSFARTSFDVTMLLLLLNSSVRRLIREASGVEEAPLLPDHVLASI